MTATLSCSGFAKKAKHWANPDWPKLARVAKLTRDGAKK
jgi:hypothetical protein